MCNDRDCLCYDGEAYDERDQLRELLQWWLDAGPDADWDDYERRVREALGD